MDGLVDEGTLTIEPMPRELAAPAPDPSFAEPDLSPQQSAAADVLREFASKDEFNVALLDGVTGSGKTEVYFEAVAEIIRRDKQAMILMPEIALTGQFLDRFASRFGVRPIEWHSELTPRTRAQLGGGRVGRSAGRGRRTLGAIFAVRKPWSHRRR